MAANINSITPILKEVYQGRIRDQLNNEITTLKRITRSGAGVTNEIHGKYVTFPVHVKRNSGIGSRHEMEALPVPGSQGYAAARVKLKYGYGGIQLSSQAITLSETNERAFAKALTEETDRLKDDLKKDMNRQIYGKGDGAVGIASGANTGAVIPVRDARNFQIGMVVDTQSGTTVDNTNLTVESIDLTAGANTVTLSAALGTATVSGDLIVRAGSGVSAAGNREITGFDAIVQDSGELYSIDPTTEREWTSEVDDNSGTLRAITEGRMIEMADRIRTRGGKTSVIFQSLGLRRAYFNLLSQQRQVVNTQEFTGGFKGLAFTTDMGEIPVVADVDAPKSVQYFVNEEALTYYRDEEWHWMDRDGSMWKQVRDASGDYDAWYARLVEYHELGTDRRNTHGRIDDLQEA